MSAKHKLSIRVGFNTFKTGALWYFLVEEIFLFGFYPKISSLSLFFFSLHERTEFCPLPFPYSLTSLFISSPPILPNFSSSMARFSPYILSCYPKSCISLDLSLNFNSPLFHEDGFWLNWKMKHELVFNMVYL